MNAKHVHYKVLCPCGALLTRCRCCPDKLKGETAKVIRCEVCVAKAIGTYPQPTLAQIRGGKS